MASHPRDNRLLAALPTSELDRLTPDLTFVLLPLKKILCEPEEPLRYVYFPIRPCVTSLLSFADNGKGAEVATVGDEGFVGAAAFLGADTSSHQAIIQVPGDAFRMPVDAFRAAVAGGELALRAGRYIHALLSMAAQSAACNALHSVEERFCRWLLIVHDRVGNDLLPLTQTFLAQMLGVRRPSVTIAAGILQRAGLITHERGQVTILDRAGLEKAACDCYAIVRRTFDRVSV